MGEMIGRFTFLVLFPFLAMGLIGGTYYLFVRPRVTFLQAYFRWWVVLIAVILFVMGIFGQVVQART